MCRRQWSLPHWFAASVNRMEAKVFRCRRRFTTSCLRRFFKPVFDEHQYLERNADVNKGVKSGTIPSALSHYVTEGFWEKRLALKFPVDEAWYRSFYGDVAREIQFGRIRDGAQHFELFGFQEGRVPSKHYQVEVAEWHDLAKKRAKPK